MAKSSKQIQLQKLRNERAGFEYRIREIDREIERLEEGEPKKQRGWADGDVLLMEGREGYRFRVLVERGPGFRDSGRIVGRLIRKSDGEPGKRLQYHYGKVLEVNGKPVKVDKR